MAALRLEPLHPEQRNLLSDVDIEGKKSRLSETNNRCCKCFGLTRLLGLSNVWFVQDPCGIICAVVTYLLLSFGEFVVNTVLLYPLGMSWYSSINCIFFNTFAIMAFISHAKAMMNDPGAIPLGNATREQLTNLGLKVGQVVYRCPKCICIKPERAHHCSICKRCIRKMDHHCPWVNNCIGENNQKYFVLFTFYIALLSCHSLIMLVVHFVTCVNSQWEEGCLSFSLPTTVVLMMMLGIEGLLFSLFTAIMFCTQVHAICTDETGIEQLKREAPTWDKKSTCLAMKAVFGHKISLNWLSPLARPDVHMGKDKAYLYNV